MDGPEVESTEGVVTGEVDDCVTLDAEDGSPVGGPAIGDLVGEEAEGGRKLVGRVDGCFRPYLASKHRAFVNFRTGGGDLNKDGETRDSP